MSKLRDHIAGFFKRNHPAQTATNEVALCAASSNAALESLTTDEFLAKLQLAQDGDIEARRFFENVHAAHVDKYGQKFIDDYSENVRLRKLGEALEEAEKILHPADNPGQSHKR